MDTDFIKFMFPPILACVWGAGLAIWIRGLGEISNIMRNNSLVGGLMAANTCTALGYVLLRVPSPTAELYVSHTACLFYAGMIIGAFI
jgi:hypothetical protein